MLTRLLAIVAKREAMRPLAEEVAAGLHWLRRWAHGLSLDNGMATVEERLDYLDKIFQEFPRGPSWKFLPRWREHFLDQWEKWQLGLFTCYRVQLLPNTNNDLESYFRRLKCHFRKLTGRQSWDSYIQRYGKEAAVFYGSPHFSQDDIINLPRDQFQVHRIGRSNKKETLAAMRRFRKRPQIYLEQLEAKWEQSNNVS